jgi:hypothetical protein
MKIPLVFHWLLHTEKKIGGHRQTERHGEGNTRIITTFPFGTRLIRHTDFFTCQRVCGEPGLSQYSVWLRAGLPGDRGSILGRGERIFPLASVSRPALGPTQPPVQWVLGVLSPGVKRGRERDADPSPPSSAEVENK